MAQLAEKLEALLNSPVEDHTGLKENYDVSIDIPPPFDANDRDPHARTFEAVHKLGLNLKNEKVMANLLVVDKVEKTPKPN